MQNIIHDSSYQSGLVPEELPYDFQQQQTEKNETPPAPMSEATKFGLGVLIVALIAGATGDGLLRVSLWGANFGVWVTLGVAAMIGLARMKSPDLLGKAEWLAAPALFFGWSWAWRDSPTLNALSLVALVLIAAIVATKTRQGKLIEASVTGILQQLILGMVTILFGPLLLIFGEIKWSELPRDGWSKNALAFARGLAIAAPLLLIFGGLFVAADAVFENIVNRTFNFDVVVLFSHFALGGLFSWLTAGFLRFIFMTSETAAEVLSDFPIKLGVTEVATVLSLLDGLFLSFVLVQFRYFFGGKANIPTGRGIEYAEYARHGFFELVWVSVLVLPLLLGVHFLLNKENPKHEKIFRVLAGIKLSLLFVIMLSAMQRMRLYQLECGLTELRVYTMAFMIWLAIVFAWFALTVLRGKRERFAFGAMLTGLVMIAALHFINPDNLIASVNLQRAREGKNFDPNYNASLSADAAPILYAGKGTLLPEARVTLETQLGYHWGNYSFGDWRSWNLSRHNLQRQMSAATR
jgi:Domain of unknown function (DUF4173)